MPISSHTTGCRARPRKLSASAHKRALGHSYGVCLAPWRIAGRARVCTGSAPPLLSAPKREEDNCVHSCCRHGQRMQCWPIALAHQGPQRPPENRFVLSIYGSLALCVCGSASASAPFPIVVKLLKHTVAVSRPTVPLYVKKW